MEPIEEHNHNILSAENRSFFINKDIADALWAADNADIFICKICGRSHPFNS